MLLFLSDVPFPRSLPSLPMAFRNPLTFSHLWYLSVASCTFLHHLRTEIKEATSSPSKGASTPEKSEKPCEVVSTSGWITAQKTNAKTFFLSSLNTRLFCNAKKSKNKKLLHSSRNAWISSQHFKVRWFTVVFGLCRHLLEFYELLISLLVSSTI